MDATVYEIVAVLVSFGIGVVATRRYYQKVKASVKELKECIEVVEKALEDDRITKEEVNRLFKECIKDFRRWI